MAQFTTTSQLGQPDQCSKRTTISRRRDGSGPRRIFLCPSRRHPPAEQFPWSPTKAAQAGQAPIIGVLELAVPTRAARAAASHTGALAQSGADRPCASSAIGIIRGEDIDHMVDVSGNLRLLQGSPRGTAAIITGSGGSDGVDGRHPVTAARAQGAGSSRTSRQKSWRCCRLCLGAEPDRRDRCGRHRQGQLRRSSSSRGNHSGSTRSC